jgi:ADP-ribose pyrophosphatase
MKSWKTLSRRTAFQQEPFLTLELHEVELPDGRRITDWPWIITPDYVNVLAQTAEGLFLFFRQRKYAVEGITLSPVGGFIEKGEAPEAAAKRELLEETGYTATEWFSLGSYAVDANRGAGHAHFFLARNARPVGQPTADDLEEQELLRLTLTEVEAALARGEFKVLAWVGVVSLGLKRLAGDPQTGL